MWYNKFMKSERGVALLLFILLASAPIFAAAQQQAPDITGSTITVPEPINNFINSLGNINLGSVPLLNDISKIAEAQNARNSLNLSDVGALWNSLNDWFNQHVGTSFSDIVRAIGSAMLWALDLMARLLKAGLSYLPGN